MTQVVRLKRVQCNYQPENARFLLECDFSKQYSHYYRKRLEKTRPFLEYNLRTKWKSNVPLYGLAQLAAAANRDSDIAGPFSPPLSPEFLQATSPDLPRRIRCMSSSQKSPVTPVRTSTQKVDVVAQSQPLPIHSPIEEPSFSGSLECVIIGTIFKRMKLQPDVVEELSRGDFHVKCERYHGHYTSQSDKLVLEDADESISLVGNINPKRFVTGIVVALLGNPINDCSQFLVQDVCYPEPNRQILYDELTASQEAKLERPLKVEGGPIYLLVISGLGFHHDMGKKSALTKALQDLIDFIWGGAKFSDDERSSQVGRILVIGDNLLEDRLVPIEQTSGNDREDLLMRMKQSRQVKPYVPSIQAVKHMDDFFAQLSKTIDIDVMPGPSDPSSHLMPQQPIHPCMLPKSCTYATFNCTTNPHHAIYNDDVEILATSGQNIDIISKFSEINDPIEIMKHHLIWGNSAPSAPDNLYSVPYEDDDPFVIDFIPEIYIAGCQDSYRTEFYYYNESTGVKSSPTDGSGSGENFHQNTKKTRTLLLTVPKFCETFSCVLINLINLESHLLSFQDTS